MKKFFVLFAAVLSGCAVVPVSQPVYYAPVPGYYVQPAPMYYAPYPYYYGPSFNLRFGGGYRGGYRGGFRGGRR